MTIDIPLKKLLRVNQNDIVRFACSDIKIVKIRELPTDKQPVKESRLDGLLEVNDELIVHIEPQAYRNKALPHRMLRYRADIGEHFISQKKCVPSIRQIVILFDRKHDNREHRLCDNWGNDVSLDFSYKVIKLWEIDRKEVMSNGLVGLSPLFPFMKREAGDTMESVFIESAELIRKSSAPLIANDLLGIMALMCENELSINFFRKFLAKEQIMKSKYMTMLFNELYLDKLEEAETRGKLEGKLEGELEGEQKGQLDMARCLLELGIPFDKIMKASKMPKKTLQKHLLGS